MIEAFDEDKGQKSQLALFPEDRVAPELACETVHIRLNSLSLHRPRQ
jgi:hypothetical protein